MTKDAYTLTNTRRIQDDGTARAHTGTLGPAVLDIGQASIANWAFLRNDPGFVATGSCDSKITFIDGETGRSSLPRLPRRTAGERAPPLSKSASCCCMASCRPVPSSKKFATSITRHTMLNEGMLNFFHGFPLRCAPDGHGVSRSLDRCRRIYHDTMDIHSEAAREIFTHRILAKLPTIAAAAYKKVGPASPLFIRATT